MSRQTDEEFVQSRFSGTGLMMMLVTWESIDLAGVDAGKVYHAKLETNGPMLLPPDDLARYRSVMGEVQILLKVRRNGARALMATGDGAVFRGTTLPMTSYDVPIHLHVKPELAHRVIRGTIPDSYWEAPAGTRMVARTR